MFGKPYLSAIGDAAEDLALLRATASDLVFIECARDVAVTYALPLHRVLRDLTEAVGSVPPEKS